MTPIDFYQLERTAQERFVGSVNGSGLPAPILKALTKPTLPLLARGVAALCFMLALAILAWGYGSLESPFAIEGLPALASVVTLVGLGTFGILLAASTSHAFRSSPFHRGLYVFPTGLIDARSSALKVYPLDGLVGVFGPDVRGLTLDFGGKSFSFPVSDPALVKAAREGIEGARHALGEASAARDSIRPRAIAALDPLQGYANPLVTSERMKRDRPAWATFAWAIALAVGLVLGAALFFLRNMRSDDVMFARASASDDTASYQAYLRLGTRHAAEVTSLVLPRALLHEAERAGTVEAVEAFIKDHPTGPVVPLARVALKKALLSALEAARKAGSLAALSEFAAQHDHKPVDIELADARHGVFQAAIDRYLAVAPDRTSPATGLVVRLVAWSEQRGPRVEVRFHGLRSRTLEKGDRAAGQSRQFKGVVSLPSRYFDDAAEKGDRDAVLATLSQKFQEVFPPEILTFAPGEALTDPDAALPAQITVPTLFIDLGVVWAGSIQASQKPRGVFLGVDLTFDALFRTPDSGKPVHVKMDMWRAPDLGAARAADTDAPEQLVYAAMRSKPFEQLGKKLVATFFAK